MPVLARRSCKASRQYSASRRDGTTFVAGYELGGKVGLVIYMIQSDGTLDGTWTIDGVNAVGTEVLTPE